MTTFPGVVRYVEGRDALIELDIEGRGKRRSLFHLDEGDDAVARGDEVTVSMTDTTGECVVRRVR